MDNNDALELDPTEIITPGADTEGDTGHETDTHTEDSGGQPETPPKNESVRDSIARSLKELRNTDGKPKDGKAKPPAKGAAAPGQQAGDKGSKTAPPQGTPPAQTNEQPAAWKSKELAPVWSGLTPAVQAAISKRESDMQKGVDQLKTRYQELDGAVAPYRDNIKRFGFTEAQAVDQLFKWQMALAGPDKVRAFVALMQSHGVDPATFAAAITGQKGATPTPPQSQNGQLPPEVKQALDGINQKLGQYDQHFAAQVNSAAAQTVMAWAKDKPHFDKVRVLMAQLTQSGAVPLKNGNIDLDAAYDMAIHSHPEVRELVAKEAREKDIAARKATADKARKAGSSMRPNAPAPPANGAGGKQDTRNETVRASISRALAELRQS